MTSFDFIINNDHPSIPGHFPGNPIVPGAVTIDNVIKAAYKLNRFKEVKSLSTIKFLQPIATNQKVVVNFYKISAELFSFECVSNKKVLVAGRLKVK
ncbi:hypothetical protein [Candidatus Thioglobus sp.]|uniref:hypothetical protein n=1 Tax=Candidatus Thioglobus sp. TaxID=2026721 RepID=UPI003D14DE2D